MLKGSVYYNSNNVLTIDLYYLPPEPLNYPSITRLTPNLLSPVTVFLLYAYNYIRLNQSHSLHTTDHENYTKPFEILLVRTFITINVQIFSYLIVYHLNRLYYSNVSNWILIPTIYLSNYRIVLLFTLSTPENM